MLKQLLAEAVASPRVARPSREFPLALFTAYLRGSCDISGATNECALALGLRLERSGALVVFSPDDVLIDALSASCVLWTRAAGFAANDTCSVLPACPRCEELAGRLAPLPPANSLDYAHRALLREFAALPCGHDAQNMPLVCQGLRLMERPGTRREEAAFQQSVRQAAARALREHTPCAELRACAYIIVIGGMEYGT